MTHSNDIYTSIQAADEKRPLAFSLEHLDTLFVEGKDAKDFLQGQLTCDINALNDFHAQPTACCNLQGRIVALLSIMIWQEGYLLLLPKDILEKTLKHFKKYALFSKVSFQKNSIDSITGFLYSAPENAYAFLSNLFIKINISPPNDALNNEAWHYQQLLQGLPDIHPSTQEAFLPHRIGLDKIEGAISFKKGCYLGQEIIARTHFKAVQKHAVYLCETASPVLPRQEIASQTKEPIGEVIDIVALSSSITHLLATIKMDSVENIQSDIKVQRVLF